MKISPRLLLAVSLASALLALFSGCSYSSRWRTTALHDKHIHSGRSAVVVLTYAEIKPGQRRAFFDKVLSVLDALPDQSGLLGFGYRFEILGNEAWTVSAWDSHGARDRFTASKAHAQAVRGAREVAGEMRFATVELPTSELPLSWSRVITLLKNTPPY